MYELLKDGKSVFQTNSEKDVYAALEEARLNHRKKAGNKKWLTRIEIVQCIKNAECVLKVPQVAINIY